jgi:hypothetical protein
MHHLPDGMHAGIGPTGADDMHRDPGKLLQRVLQSILHGPATRLLLPATKATAVVLDSQSDPHPSPLDKIEERHGTDQRQSDDQVVPNGKWLIN